MDACETEYPSIRGQSVVVHRDCEGFIEVTMSKYIRFEVTHTSFQSYGIRHLRRALSDEFNNIPSLQPVNESKKKPRPDENVRTFASISSGHCAILKEARLASPSLD